MKDANTQALRKKEIDDVKEDREREEYHKRLAAKMSELRKSEGYFLYALQRVVMNIDDEQLCNLHDSYLTRPSYLAILINHQIDLMAKEELGEE